MRRQYHEAVIDFSHNLFVVFFFSHKQKFKIGSIFHHYLHIWQSIIGEKLAYEWKPLLALLALHLFVTWEAVEIDIKDGGL